MKKIVNGVETDLSDADLAQAEADAAEWAAGAKQRELDAIESASGLKRWERDVIMAVLPPDHPAYAKAAEAEVQAAPVRAALSEVKQ